LLDFSELDTHLFYQMQLISFADAIFSLHKVLIKSILLRTSILGISYST